MSSQQLLLMGSGTRNTATLTVGNDGSGAGFSATNYGIFSLSVKSKSVQTLLSNGSNDLQLSIGSTTTLVKGFISGIVVEDGSGVDRYYPAGSSSFAYSGVGNVGIWSWGSGSNRVYAVADNAETHSVSVIV